MGVKMFRILVNGFFGTKYIGITVATEEEAKKLVKKYNEQKDSPYISYSYRKQGN